MYYLYAHLTGNVSLHTLFIPETGDLKCEDVFRAPANKPQSSVKSVLTEHLQKEIILRWFTDSFTAFRSYLLQNVLAWQTAKAGQEIGQFRRNINNPKATVGKRGHKMFYC